MPKTTTNNGVTVGDGGARFAPATSRRLFYFEREAAPVLVGSSARVQTRVRLNLPDNGAHRDRGPGVYRNGNITQVIHADGCNFPVSRCRGECTTPREVAP
jgi:hypothetical protein